MLLATLNTLFCAAVSFFIVFLAARSYLEAGSRALLSLGCGALTFGLTYVAAGLLMTRLDTAVTVHNAGTCLAGAFYALSAGWALAPKRGESAPASAPRTLGLFFMGVFAAMSLMIWASLAGVLPDFYLVGQGFTTLRQIVLGVTVVEFALASLCFGILYARSRSRFQLWYCLGLALIGLGMGTLIIEGAPATPLSWVGRSAQYLGGLYMLIAVSTLAQGSRGWKIPLEQALHESEERYRTLVDLAPDAVLVHRDGRIVYCNCAALQLYRAVTPRQLQGRKCLRADPSRRARGRTDKNPNSAGRRRDSVARIPPPAAGWVRSARGNRSRPDHLGWEACRTSHNPQYNRAQTGRAGSAGEAGGADRRQ